MKILIISQYFYPEQFRINDIASELVRRGNQVVVLTGLPNYPKGEIFDGFLDSGNKEELINGVRVFRCSCRPRHRGTKNLILNYLSFVIEASKSINRLDRDFDCVFVYGLSPVTQAIPALKIKKRLHIPVVYYCLDLWPEAVRGEQNGHKQIGIHNPIYLIAKVITKHIYKKCDLIVNKCDDFVDYNYKVCDTKKEKQRVLFEHAEDIYINVSDTPKENGIIDFMFLGNIGKAQNCDHIVKAFSKLRNNNAALLHFVGDGSDINRIKALVKEKGLEKQVVFHGRHPVETIGEFYELADVCVLTLSNRTKTGLTFPAKLTGYMAASRPIIASINGSSRKIIEEACCGVSVNADDIDGLAKEMQKIIDNPECIYGLGQNGRRYFEKHFTLNIFIDRLEKLFNTLLPN